MAGNSNYNVLADCIKKNLGDGGEYVVEVSVHDALYGDNTDKAVETSSDDVEYITRIIYGDGTYIETSNKDVADRLIKELKNSGEYNFVKII